MAVYSDADAQGLAVRTADQAVHIGPAPSSESYLRADLLLEVAARYNCDAVHPGYGFLSENEGFAQAVIEAGLVWIGAPPAAIASMGSKTAARERMVAAGVPVVPGTLKAAASPEDAQAAAKEIGFPLLIKASAGGGGKGMRAVHAPEDLARSMELAQSEARSSFGDDAVYMERLVLKPRHVEIQVLADAHGAVVHLGERDCSIQRRHQKVFEEAPCPVLASDTREAMAAAAVNAAKAVDYQGAGTVEFLLDASGEFYFLEMNTRLQVEHPITECITGVDLAQAQLRVAAGEPLWFSQADVVLQGHAVECRVYAEDPEKGFQPSPGPLIGYREPAGPGVRVDSGVVEGMEVPIHYDPMIAKLVVWGPDREAALARARRALLDYQIVGTATSIPFFLHLFEDPEFRRGIYDTSFISDVWLDETFSGATLPGDEVFMLGAILKFEQEAGKVMPAASASGGSAWRGLGDWGRRGWRR